MRNTSIYQVYVHKRLENHYKIFFKNLNLNSGIPKDIRYN